MALLLTLATGAWAQDPDPIDLTPSADGTVWTLSTMPEYDVELEVTYYTDEEVAEMAEMAEMAKGYYLVGNMNSWTPTPQYKLSENPGNAAEQMITLCLEAGAEFKIIYSENGTAAQTWFPGDGGNYTVQDAVLYTVYFRSDYQGGSDWHYGCIYLSEGVYFTADGEAWTLAQMPPCDVELDVEYFADATLATLPAAAEGVVEGTDADLLTPDTSNDGTLVYAIGQSSTEAPASGWSETIPTTEGLEAGTYYVWYKVVGDAEHSDSEPQSIEVTVAEAPARLAVTIDDAGKDTDNWQATPAEQQAGQTVTLKYNGKKKVKSITIEAAQ